MDVKVIKAWVIEYQMDGSVNKNRYRKTGTQPDLNSKGYTLSQIKGPLERENGLMVC